MVSGLSTLLTATWRSLTLEDVVTTTKTSVQGMPEELLSRMSTPVETLLFSCTAVISV